MVLVTLMKFDDGADAAMAMTDGDARVDYDRDYDGDDDVPVCEEEPREENDEQMSIPDQHHRTVYITHSLSPS